MAPWASRNDTVIVFQSGKNLSFRSARIANWTPRRLDKPYKLMFEENSLHSLAATRRNLGPSKLFLYIAHVRQSMNVYAYSESPSAARNPPCYRNF